MEHLKQVLKFLFMCNFLECVIHSKEEAPRSMVDFVDGLGLM